MLGSKSTYFYQSKEDLKAFRSDMILLLTVKEFSEKEIWFYLEAYDFFCQNPSLYDGETLVKDLNDLHGLSIAGMAHDYEYVFLKVWKDLIKKVRSDWNYGRTHERLGKGITTPYSRALGLIISTPIYYIIKLF